ncbi:MAG: pyridoxamine 5'-phosphate oxidase family protein [Candidatus Nitrosopolaris sp.]
MQHENVIQVLNDPLAKELLTSAIPVRLAYTGSDGFPRVVPVGFYWNGAQFIIGTSPNAPKVRALTTNPKVALTIDTNTFPPHVLLVRGTASIEVIDGVPPEYLQGAKKFVEGQRWRAFEEQVHAMYKQMARIAIVPEWAEVLDFETRIPNFMLRLLERD